MVSPLVPHRHAANAGGVVMHGTLRALLSAYDVTLVTLVTPDTIEEELVRDLGSPGLEVKCVVRRRFTGRRGLVSRFDLAVRRVLGPYPMRTLYFREPAFQRVLTRLLSHGGFDALQVEDNAMAAYDYARRPPAVLTEHEVRSDDDVRSELEILGAKAGASCQVEQERWRNHQRRSYRKFERVQVFTERDVTLARVLAGDAANRIVVNPFGVEIPRNQDQYAEVANSIVFVAGFLHPPNVAAAIWLAGELMPLLRQRALNARLTIVGSNPPPHVVSLACSDIEVTGYVPFVAPDLASAAVVVAPLWSHGGMRYKVLEAMSWGKAVVASPVAAAGILNASPAAIVVASDLEAFAANVEELLLSADKRRKLGDAARLMVSEHFSWEAHTRRLLAMHAEIATGTPAASCV